MDDDVVVGRDAVPVVCQGRGDNYFNVAEQVLAIQRGFARSVLAATISVATIAASAAQNQAKKPTAKRLQVWTAAISLPLLNPGPGVGYAVRVSGGCGRHVGNGPR
jgi:hypothetical protein